MVAMATDNATSDGDRSTRQELANQPLGTSTQKVYGMTRRFSLRATMLLVAVAAGLLALLQFVGIEREVSACALVVMVASATAQAFMFGGKQPRRASVITGAIAGVLLSLISIIYAVVALNSQGLNAWRIHRDWPEIIIFGGIIGSMAGYAMGGLVAAVFLLLDKYDAWLPKKAAPARDVDPLADD
jgi:hypothetical protein